MPESSAIYQRYGDNIFRTATPSVETGSAPTGYGADKLVDDNPAHVAKITSGTGAWLFDHGSAVDLQVVALIHHNFDAGGDVKVQRNATNSWGGPSFEMAFTIPAWLGAATGARRWPENPWLDLTEDAQYDPTGWRYTRIVVTGNSQNLQLGEAWGGSTIRRLTPDLQWNFKRVSKKKKIANVTTYDVENNFTLGTTQWRIEGTHLFDGALRTALQDHWMDADGSSLPWLLVPDGFENRCYLVRWTDEMREEIQMMDALVGSDELHSHNFSVIEASRGLRPGV